MKSAEVCVFLSSFLRALRLLLFFGPFLSVFASCAQGFKILYELADLLGGAGTARAFTLPFFLFLCLFASSLFGFLFFFFHLNQSFPAVFWLFPSLLPFHLMVLSLIAHVQLVRLVLLWMQAG